MNHKKIEQTEVRKLILNHKGIEKNYNKLIKIYNMPTLNERKKHLRKFCKEIGAGKEKEHRRGDDYTVSELIDNCHYALQTASMINMCKISSRNFIIALIATFIALVSAIAAWVAACK